MRRCFVDGKEAARNERSRERKEEDWGPVVETGEMCPGKRDLWYCAELIMWRLCTSASPKSQIR